VLAGSGAADATDNRVPADNFQYVETTRDLCLKRSPSVILKGAEIRRTSAEGQSHGGALADQGTVRRETEVGQHGQTPVGLAGPSHPDVHTLRNWESDGGTPRFQELSAALVPPMFDVAVPV
jgi:hypothetical protein